MTMGAALPAASPAPLRGWLLRAALVAAIGIVLAWHTTPTAAATAANAQTFVNDVANQALKTMAQSRTEDEREARFTTLLRSDFDMARISRFVLGRYWAAASEQERKDFGVVFEAYLARAYSHRFGEYAGETVKVVGQRAEGDNVTIVSSQIIHQDNSPPVKLDWRIYKNGDDYRIVDVSVEGVSMVLTHKEEFASIIERDGAGVAGLIRSIQAKLNSGSSAQK